MINISPNLYKRLRNTLLNCGPFANTAELKAVFIDARISCWRDNLPDAADTANRVNVVIDFLSRQSNEIKENALVLLLHVLSDQRSPEDVCHQQLEALAGELQQQLEVSGATIYVESANEIAYDESQQGKSKPPIIPPAVPRPLNMSFEGSAKYRKPFGWFNSKGFVGGVSTAYNFEVVPRSDRPNEYCIRMENARAAFDEFGSLMQRCLVGPFLAGKAVLLQAEAKTENVNQWAGIWLRADNADGNDLFFDNMSNRPIRGSTNWTQYTIDAVLPIKTVWLNYGIVLVGQGVMWADNFKLWVWDTNMGRWHPV